MTTIYHICPQTEWRAALEQGAYTADTLESEGFIHCSKAEQVAKVANAFYADVPELVLLHIVVEKLAAELKWEANDGDILGNSPPGLLERLHRAHSRLIVAGQNRGKGRA